MMHVGPVGHGCNRRQMRTPQHILLTYSKNNIWVPESFNPWKSTNSNTVALPFTFHFRSKVPVALELDWWNRHAHSEPTIALYGRLLLSSAAAVYLHHDAAISIWSSLLRVAGSAPGSPRKLCAYRTEINNQFFQSYGTVLSLHQDLEERAISEGLSCTWNQRR